MSYAARCHRGWGLFSTVSAFRVKHAWRCLVFHRHFLPLVFVLDVVFFLGVVFLVFAAVAVAFFLVAPVPAFFAGVSVSKMIRASVFCLRSHMSRNSFNNGDLNNGASPVSFGNCPCSLRSPAAVNPKSRKYDRHNVFMSCHVLNNGFGFKLIAPRSLVKFTTGCAPLSIYMEYTRSRSSSISDKICMVVWNDGI